LVQAMSLLSEGSDLTENLVGRGFARVKKFNWEGTAKKTLSVFNSLAK